MNVRTKFKVRSFTRSWDNIGYLKWCSPWICPRSLFSKIFNELLFRWTRWKYRPNLKSRPPILEKRGCRGSSMVSFERALVTSYRPSVVTFPLFLRVSEILPLLCSSTPLFPTPPFLFILPQISPCSSIGGWPLVYEERRCWANWQSFHDIQPMWAWSTNVTDGQTDGRTDRRHAIAIPRFAYYWCRLQMTNVLYFNVK